MTVLNITGDLRSTPEMAVWPFQAQHKCVRVSTFLSTTPSQIFFIIENIQRPARSVKIQSKSWVYEHFDVDKPVADNSLKCNFAN